MIYKVKNLYKITLDELYLDYEKQIESEPKNLIDVFEEMSIRNSIIDKISLDMMIDYLKWIK